MLELDKMDRPNQLIFKVDMTSLGMENDRLQNDKSPAISSRAFK